MQNLYGGESIAIDPSNPRNVYFDGGMFDWWRGGPWDVLKSTDQGKTWERTNPTGPRRLGERWTPGVLAPTGHHKPRPIALSRRENLSQRTNFISRCRIERLIWRYMRSTRAVRQARSARDTFRKS